MSKRLPSHLWKAPQSFFSLFLLPLCPKHRPQHTPTNQSPCRVYNLLDPPPLPPLPPTAPFPVHPPPPNNFLAPPTTPTSIQPSFHTPLPLPYIPTKCRKYHFRCNAFTLTLYLCQEHNMGPEFWQNKDMKIILQNISGFLLLPQAIKYSFWGTFGHFLKINKSFVRFDLNGSKIDRF
jgi:hypothetical protein